MSKWFGVEGVDFEGVTDPHLFRLKTYYLGKAFIDELRVNNCLLGFNRISGCQIIIIDSADDARSSVQATGGNAAAPCSYR